MSYRKKGGLSCNTHYNMRENHYNGDMVRLWEFRSINGSSYHAIISNCNVKCLELENSF